MQMIEAAYSNRSEAEAVLIWRYRHDRLATPAGPPGGLPAKPANHAGGGSMSKLADKICKGYKQSSACIGLHKKKVNLICASCQPVAHRAIGKRGSPKGVSAL